MARKTKKEKMSAQIRKLRQMTSSPVPENQASPSQNSSLTSSNTVSIRDLQIAKHSKITTRVENGRYDYSYVFSDLRKLGILIFATIFFEVALNLTLRTSFAKLILRTFGIEI